MKSDTFINYAHRGASEYLPENTFLAFYTGLFMGANGIETDVRKTKDGVPVLFHDSTLLRMTGENGAIEDYTFAQLQNMRVTKNSFSDRIVSLEDFLAHFAFRDLTFAIELKGADTEAATAALLRKYGMQDKTVVTSFYPEYLMRFREIAPEFEIGFLTQLPDSDGMDFLSAVKAEELCPRADLVTKEAVEAWHSAGFRVRAWGVKTEEAMQHAFYCGVDGMTVNFPDKLTQLLNCFVCL